jgi:NitT/TauT family transport system substrate-binding protein
MSLWKRWKPFAAPAFGVSVIVGLILAGNGAGTAGGAAAGRERVRLAYFPNLTHAAGIVAQARGEFRNALPLGVDVDPKVFNAGPEEMEALLAGEVDLGYVGPSPAINTYLKSGGKALRILAGASSGGAALVARAGTGIRSIRDLDGKRLAVPQLGGTQDVSARHFLGREGLRSREKGGTVEVLPIKNPDILALFKRKELDAAWVPEPWATRLLKETDARLVVDERDLWPDGRFATTVVVVRTAYLEKHPDRVEELLEAHVRSLGWLKKNPEEARALVNAELKRLTGKELPQAVLEEAWKRLEFTDDPLPATIHDFVAAATDLGYLSREQTDLAALIETTPLKRARRQALTLLRPVRE